MNYKVSLLILLSFVSFSHAGKTHRSVKPRAQARRADRLVNRVKRDFQKVVLFRLVTSDKNTRQVCKMAGSRSLTALRDRHKDTLLHVAAACGASKMVRILLEHVSPAAKNRSGQTPHYYAVGCRKALSILLEKVPAPAADTYGFGLAHVAVMDGSLQAVRNAVEVGKADLLARDSDGFTAAALAFDRLDYAQRTGKEDQAPDQGVFEYLQEKTWEQLRAKDPKCVACGHYGASSCTSSSLTSCCTKFLCFDCFGSHGVEHCLNQVE